MPDVDEPIIHSRRRRSALRLAVLMGVVGVAAPLTVADAAHASDAQSAGYRSSEEDDEGPPLPEDLDASTGDVTTTAAPPAAAPAPEAPAPEAPAPAPAPEAPAPPAATPAPVPDPVAPAAVADASPAKETVDAPPAPKPAVVPAAPATEPVADAGTGAGAGAGTTDAAAALTGGGTPQAASSSPTGGAAPAAAPEVAPAAAPVVEATPATPAAATGGPLPQPVGPVQDAPPARVVVATAGAAIEAGQVRPGSSADGGEGDVDDELGGGGDQTGASGAPDAKRPARRPARGRAPQPGAQVVSVRVASSAVASGPSFGVFTVQSTCDDCVRYRTVRGDSLWVIADHLLGDRATHRLLVRLVRELQRLNDIVPAHARDGHLAVGVVLVLPKLFEGITLDWPA